MFSRTFLDTRDAGRGRGNGRGRGTGKQKAKRGTGRSIGGGSLTSDISIVTTTTKTRTISTTVEPRHSDFSQQIMRCNVCDDLGHCSMLCEQQSDARPPPITCRQCKHKYSYTDNQQLITETELCSAHLTKILQPTTTSLKKIKRAEFAIEKINELVSHGTALDDALEWMGLSIERYEKLMKRLE